MNKSTSIIKTSAGSSYIGKLCRHFAHKIKTEYTPTIGKAEFPAGICHMHANAEHLFVEIDANDSQGLAKIKGVLERHLVKFAYKEDLTITWQDTR